MRSRVAVVGILAVGLLAMALPAKGCSCQPHADPREELQRADGAIVGTFVETRRSDTGFEVVHTLRVDEEIKGDFGETVEVHSEESTCGLSGAPGSQVGLLLTWSEENATWSASHCSRMDPRDLRAAAAPLPASNGRGSVRLLAGGSWGEVGHLALDRVGRTLGYGTGDHHVADLAVCPGGRTFAALYWTGEGWRLALRRLRTNEALWDSELTVPGGDGFPVATGCTAGRTVAFVVWRAYAEPEGTVVRVDGTSSRVVYRGGLFDAALPGGWKAYLQRGARGREVVELDLASGRRQTLGHTFGNPTDLALSPDGHRLAAHASGSAFVFDLVTGERHRRAVGAGPFADVAWFDRAHLGLFPVCGDRRVKVLPVSLRSQRRLPGSWCGNDVVVSGGAAYGLRPNEIRASAQLRRATIREGATEVVRTFPSAAIDVLAAVPGRREVRWPLP